MFFLESARRRGAALWNYPQEHLVVIIEEKVCPFVKFEIIVLLLCCLLDLLTNKQWRTWRSMINLRIDSRVKIRQIPAVSFQTASQFLFKFCIILQYHETKFLCTFLAQTSYTFLDFWVFRSKIVKSLIPTLKQVNSSSNFVPFFIVMKYSSPVLF